MNGILFFRVPLESTISHIESLWTLFDSLISIAFFVIYEWPISFSIEIEELEVEVSWWPSFVVVSIVLFPKSCARM